MSPLSPKNQFRLNRLRNRWQAWRAQARQTGQAVMAEQKMCPNCRALVARGDSQCPYCGQRLRVLSATPAGRVATRLLPGELPVTGMLILANLVLFVFEYVAGGVSIAGGLMSGPGGQAELRLGASLPLVLMNATHQYGRWFTAQFLHANLLHIGMNMWVLFDIGPLVESFYGHAKLLVMYLLAGAGGYVVSSAFGHESLGASGAIFGLVGVLIGYGTRNAHTSMGRELRARAMRYVIYVVILTFGVNVMGGGIDNSAHLGGLATGFLLALVISDSPPLGPAQERFWSAAQWLMVLVVVASFASVLTHPLG